MWKAAHRTADAMWRLGCLANNIKQELETSFVESIMTVCVKLLQCGLA